ncbi:hypothetical protein P691DRAFT_345245 [Macrolepiota fuliginosa MF-IS2]|uniref:Uncharacterized protein n=1 Tax=Macrolepiota fuliginosa MF-IS2 TaxID=1400762 RepID=A0A9P5XLY6_9AGAR|nr:hypothetical protein P691DRAFT_345245 [Macrolepiota fuliginosa MF-IS2]
MASIGSADVDHNIVTVGFPTALSAYIGAVLFEAFLFGLYTILFVISVYVLLWCNKSRQWFLLMMSVMMYIIAMSDIVYTLWLLFKVVLGLKKVMFWHLYPKYSLFVTNNLAAHALLLYRCVAVCGHNWWLIGVGVSGLIAITGVGYALEGTSLGFVSIGWIYLSLALAYNLALTGLAAGRILYITKQNYQLLPQPLKRRYIITIAVLVESGVLYTIYLGTNLAFQKNPTANAILDCAAVQVVGMVPTLILVQVGLGRTLGQGKNNEETVPEYAMTRRQTYEDVSTRLMQHRPSTSVSSRYPLMRPRADS